LTPVDNFILCLLDMYLVFTYYFVCKLTVGYWIGQAQMLYYQSLSLGIMFPNGIDF